MRHIAALGPGVIPKDDEYDFRSRANMLVDRWHIILNAGNPAKVRVLLILFHGVRSLTGSLIQDEWRKDH